MSINVTVSGNPICIKRGKMVTCDPNHAKKEFDKRRLMRLEQVRQQSKDIAEDVRNKVRKEKQKQMGDIEREGKEKLKNWQNRKLLEIQNQYREALKDIGMGHKQAEELQDESEVLEEQKSLNHKVAKQRGSTAAGKLQADKNQKSFEKAKPIQQRKLVRDIENTRSALVAKLKQTETKRKRKQPKANINITVPDTDTENQPETNTSDEESTLETPDESSEDSGVFPEPKRACEPLETIESVEEPSQSRLDRQYPQERRKSTGSKEAITINPEYLPCDKHCVDTRISDRIKRRELMASQPDYCDEAGEISPAEIPPFSTKIHEHLLTHRFPPVREVEPKFSSEGEPESTVVPRSKTHEIVDKIPDVGSNKPSYSQSRKSEDVQQKSRSSHLRQSELAAAERKSKEAGPTRTSLLRQPEQIPEKPPVKLRSVGGSNTTKTSQKGLSFTKVRTYDHLNRFSQDKYYPPGSFVEKLTNDSVEVLPNVTSEAEYEEKMKQREREASIRGKKALEKEKVHRDYKELMKKLPILQNQERIFEISDDKPEYHMDDDRLKELERKRQNTMENAYTKIIQQRQPAIVTLPKVNHEEPAPNGITQPVGTWDVDFTASKMFTGTEVQEIVDAFTREKPKDRRAKLKELLLSLKSQKEQLIKEIRALPKDNTTITDLINDLDSFNDIGKTAKEKSKRKRDPEESFSSTESTSGDKPRRSREKRRHDSVSPRKKPRKKSVLILQNTSTQTTPKPMEGKESQTCLSDVKKAPLKLCDYCKKHSPCICTKHHKQTTEKTEPLTEELCKIVIKINDDDPSEVLVKPGKKEEIIIKAPKSPKKIEETKTKPVKIAAKPKEKPKTPPQPKWRSWREEFSKNSQSTTSTSYLSLPERSGVKETTFTSITETSIYNLRKQQKQTNALNVSDTPRTPIDPRLLNCIRKLLSLSRKSIEEYSVSTSDVPTPSQSVVETMENNPAMQLHNIIRYFNLRVEDVAKELSCSPDSEPRSSYSPRETSRSGRSKTPSPVDKSNMMDVADSCSKRIENLTKMIQKLREDKQEIIKRSANTSGNSTASTSVKTNEQDFTTKYLDIPDLPVVESNPSGSASSSLNEEELNRKLLDIDMSLAKKLRKYTPPEPEVPKPEDQLDTNSPNHAIRLRLQRLMHTTSTGRRSPSPVKIEEKPTTEEPFVPFLLDIPKLPKFEAQPDTIDRGNNKKPPPVARRFNGNIEMVPHELSTIVEADSQLIRGDLVSGPSTPRASKKLPQEKNLDVHSELSLPQIVIPQKDSSSSDEKKTPTPLSSPRGTKLICDRLVCAKLKANTSSSSSDEVENMESMLKSIGMAWAIPTLHKTQEALALTSSSSSLELSAKNRPDISKTTDSSGSGEVSLSSFLKKQMFTRISSSTLKTDASASPGSIFETSDLSAIYSVEKSKQRTSTPVVYWKSDKVMKDAFSGDSDMSSVRDKSTGKVSFQTASESGG